MPLRAKNRAGLAHPNPVYHKSGHDDPATTAVPDDRVRVEWYVNSKPPNKSMIENMTANVCREYGFSRGCIRSVVHNTTAMGSKSDGWHVTIDFQKRDTKAWYTAHVYTDSVKVGRDWQHRGFDTKLGEGKNPFFYDEKKAPKLPLRGMAEKSWMLYAA